MAPGWCWDKEWEVSTRTVGQFFVVDFLSFYYENVHTYLMDYCRDVMNTTIQITAEPVILRVSKFQTSKCWTRPHRKDYINRPEVFWVENEDLGVA